MDGPRNYQDEPDGRWYPGYSERYPAPDGRSDDDERYRVPEPRYSDLPDAGGDPGRFREGYQEAEAYSSSSSRTDPGLVARNASPMGPRSGVELPPLPLPSDPGESRFQSDPTESRFPDPGESRYHSDQSESRFHTEPIDRAALRRTPGPVGAPTQLAPPVSGPPPMAPPPMAPPQMPMQVGPPPSHMQPGPYGADGMPGPGPAGGAPMADPSGAIYRTRHTGIAILLVIVSIAAELLTVRMLLAGEFGHPFQPAEVLAGIFTMVGTPLVTMGLYGLMTGAAAASGPAPGRAWLRPPLALLPVGLALILAGALAI
ncbi:MAG TPA: hypothetical protein VGJ07_27075 [Rugosimonospora sp.]